MSNIKLEEGDNCPKCGKRLDAVTPVGVQATEAKAGDFTVCLECGAALVMTDKKGHLRPITEEEEKKMDNETRDMLNRIQSIIRAKNRSRFAM